MTYQQLRSEIVQKKFRPLYFLAGEEAYFIDALAQLIEEHALSEEEKSFNQSILYGADTDLPTIIGEAKRYPMMAERVVVIVREAQHLRNFDLLEDYAKNPQPSTVLVFAYKGKKLDGRKGITKLLKKSHVYLEFAKLYDNQVPDWIRNNLQGLGIGIEPKAVLMLSESLGNDLGRVDSELRKLAGLLKPGQSISPDLVEENVGISKDFNNFELCNAINQGQFGKAMRIQAYFAANPKDNPSVLTLSILYRNFRILMILNQLKGASQGEMCRAAGVSPHFLPDYLSALPKYNIRKLARIFGYLREADMRSKGVNDGGTNDQELLKELLFKIFYV